MGIFLVDTSQICIGGIAKSINVPIYLPIYLYLTKLHKRLGKIYLPIYLPFHLYLIRGAHRKVALYVKFLSLSTTLWHFSPRSLTFNTSLHRIERYWRREWFLFKHFFMYIVWALIGFNPTLILSKFCKFETQSLNLKPLYHLRAKASVDGGNGAHFKLWSFHPPD